MNIDRINMNHKPPRPHLTSWSMFSVQAGGNLMKGTNMDATTRQERGITWEEFMKKVADAPDISGSQEIGWDAKYTKPGLSGYFHARFPAGTPYGLVVKCIEQSRKG